MEDEKVATEVEDPKFISYLLDPRIGHDCYFVVGNDALVTPAKIGVVKKMLIAHSAVLRNELEDDDKAEKEVVKVNDIKPHTFNNFLRCVYGYDVTGKLSFDDADDLLYVADKYLVDDLINRLATRLMSLLTYDNICGLMNNPACYRHLELDRAITRIIQYDTGKVLESPLFPNLAPNAFLKIVDQESLSVKEGVIWKAAVKWAKHQNGEEESANVERQSLRSTLLPFLPHLRLCTLTGNELCEDVVPTKVLEAQELFHVSNSIGLKKVDDECVTVCNSVTPRTEPKKTFGATVSSIYTHRGRYSAAALVTKAFHVALSSFFGLNDWSIHLYEVNELLDFKRIERSNEKWSLKPNSSYMIVIICNGDFPIYSPSEGNTFENEHFTIKCSGSHVDTVYYSIDTSCLSS